MKKEIKIVHPTHKASEWQGEGQRMKKYWSKKVTEESNALDLEKGVFTWNDPEKIAASLANSAKKSMRRKGTPLQSAMSMLNFYINRSGKNLPKKRQKILQKAKVELSHLNWRVLK